MRSNRTLYIVLCVIVAGALLLMWNHDSGQTMGIDNSNFASLIWLGTLGLVIGAAVFARGRLNSGAMLQQVAIWLAIFLALMVGYRLYNGDPVFPGSRPAPPAQNEGIMTSANGLRDAG